MASAWRAFLLNGAAFCCCRRRFVHWENDPGDEELDGFPQGAGGMAVPRYLQVRFAPTSCCGVTVAWFMYQAAVAEEEKVVREWFGFMSRPIAHTCGRQGEQSVVCVVLLQHLVGI